MKQIIFIVAAFLISVTTAFAQVYKVHVSWPAEECNCLDQGNSYYAVKVVVYDEANDMVVVEGIEERVDFGTYSVNISVPEVNDHCADPNLPYTPNMKVMYGAVVMYDYTNPPTDLCNNYYSENHTCSDFANNNPLLLTKLPSFN
ncbi:MAG TPA: hypothetical protein VIN10_15640 [Bacteroidales bacterium]